MKTVTKIALLNQITPRGLIENLSKIEVELEEALIREADFRNQNHQYLASSGSDCGEVKKLLAEIATNNPGKNTVEREAWVTMQRVDNQEVNNAITRQREVAFLIDDHRVKVEMAKKRHESTRAVIALRTAQINFLAE